jgi:dTMP kinase
MIQDNPYSFKLNDKFIAVEGIDGSGKTSLIMSLIRYFSGLGHNGTSTASDIKTFRELLNDSTADLNFVYQPGGTKLGNRVRAILKDVDLNLRPQISHELFEIARLDLLLNLAEQRSKGSTDWVICDRHTDSTYAYQCTEGVLYEDIERSHERYKSLPSPDVVIYLDIKAELARERTRNRFGIDLDRYDTKPISFFEKCLSIYNKRIDSNRSKYFVVDASKTTDEILDFILDNLRFSKN